MGKLSDQALSYLLNTIETTPYGKVIVEISENSKDVIIVVEGRIKFPKPDPDEEVITSIKNQPHHG